MSKTKVDEAYVRRALAVADLNAVRVAMYHATGDPELVALGPVAQLSPDAKARLVDIATAHLLALPAGATLPELSDGQLRGLMEMASGAMTDIEFEARRGLVALEEHPWACEWTRGRPALPEGFHVAIIGAGFSGVACGVQMQRLGIPFTIFEKRDEVGGVWSTNKYPDARVDTASITYEYNFEKNYPWSEYFARQPEVRGYIEHVAAKYGVLPNVRVNSPLQAARWDASRSKWVLTIGQTDGTSYEFEANVLVNAVGVFANPLFADFAGSEHFTGQIVHPTQWGNGNYDATGKTVAVIGNGSTGVQLVAPVAAAAKQVYVFQRTAQWISPRPKYGEPIEPEHRWLYDTMPGYWNWGRYSATAGLFASHELMVQDPDWIAKGGLVSEKNDKIRSDLTGYIKSQIGDRPDLLAKLMPDCAPMTRRPVVDNGWYKSLTRDNVELVVDSIRRFTPSGIETDDGQIRDVDLVITATGFDVVKFLWPAQYEGVGGVKLHDRWAGDGPRAYLSLMVPQFPNMFMLYGPNSQPVSGGTSLPSWYQIWSGYIGQCIVQMIENGHTAVEVTEAAHDRYNAALDEEAKKLVMMNDAASIDKNYYVNEFGRLQVNSPFESPYYHKWTATPDWNDLVLS